MHPDSFIHNAEGDGFAAYIKSQMRLSKALWANLSLNYRDMSANRKGVDKVFFSNANGSTAETKLNSVNWTSLSISIGLNYQFY